MADKAFLFVTLIYFWTFVVAATFAQDWKQFVYNGFQSSKLLLDGGATVHPNGLLQLSNFTKQITGHAFHPTPIKFNSSLSFSTTFTFAMYPQQKNLSGQGIVFVVSQSPDFSHAAPDEYLGIFNFSSNTSHHIFAVELDTVKNQEVKDIDSNHIGIDVNSVESVSSATAGYFSDAEGRNKSLNLLSAKPMQVWINLSEEMIAEVAIAPLGLRRPSRPLLSTHVNLTGVISDSMYVGFSAATGEVLSSRHYLLGWSFSQGGQAHGLDLSKLPRLPRFRNQKRRLSVVSMILLIIISVILITVGLTFYLIRRKKYEEIFEGSEQEYLLRRFSYKDLYRATKGFKDRELLGAGGFGKVYKGVLPSTKTEVAVKKVSHPSGQGIRQFLAEISSMGRLRHRNLVQLLGYCRRKGELLLVYDYMPNGSLDQYLYNDEKRNLSWSERLNIIKGVASALLYLHQEWEQVVVHRDVKPNNVLLDADMNARLGDFGLARLYDHGTNPQTTHVVGTIGYLAPELTRRAKATTSTDVFSFGIFILEVACGRSPISPKGSGEEKYLVNWVYDFWKQGPIDKASDPRLEGYYSIEEMELALKIGMLCCHRRPEARPNMRQVVQFLDGDATLSGNLPDDAEIPGFSSLDQTSVSFPLSFGGATTYSSYSTESILKVGR